MRSRRTCNCPRHYLRARVFKTNIILIRTFHREPADARRYAQELVDKWTAVNHYTAPMHVILWLGDSPGAGHGSDAHVVWDSGC